MAGYRDTTNNTANGIFNIIKGPLKKILRAGQEYDDLIIRQKLGLGANEASLMQSGNTLDEDSFFIARSTDINQNMKAIGFYQKDYPSQRDFLNKMAAHREISKLLDIVSDEAIVYDEGNYFAKPNLGTLNDLNPDYEESIKKAITENFEHIYSIVFGFNQGNTAWRYFRKYLVEGILAFELVYDRYGKKIIKAIELDAAKIIPSVIDLDGVKTRVWIQYPDDTQMKRIIPDTHIVYISHGKSQNFSEISYVQSMIRSFNLYRTIENVAVIWTIMHASFRLKMIVPVAGSRQKNEEAVGQLIARYREEIIIDDQSGEVRIDGNPSLNLFRNYAIGSKNGQQTEIESLKFEGYDLSNPELLKYWRDKLWEDSQVPFTRLQKDASSTFISNVDGMERDEIQFSRFVNRLRSDFQEILIKPLVTQMFLDFPEINGDQYFKSKVGIKFNSDNVFEELRIRDTAIKKLDFVKSLLEIQDTDGESPYFDLDLLMQTYGPFDYDFLEKNKKFKEEKAEKEKNNEEGEEEGSDSSPLDLLPDEGPTASPEPAEPAAEEPPPAEPPEEVE